MYIVIFNKNSAKCKIVPERYLTDFYPEQLLLVKLYIQIKIDIFCEEIGKKKYSS